MDMNPKRHPKDPEGMDPVWSPSQGCYGCFYDKVTDSRNMKVCINAPCTASVRGTPRDIIYIAKETSNATR